MNIGTSLKTISKNQLCSFIGTGGYVELAENDVLSDGSIVTSAAVLPLLNSRNDKGDGILPPGYQRVEFLTANGSQYILLPERFNFGHEEDMPNSGILLKTSDYATKATNYAFDVPVSTSAGSMPKSAFYIGRRSANESLLRVGLNGVYGLSEPYIDGKVYEASINFLNSGVIEVGEKSQNIIHNPTAYGAPFYILRSVSVCRLYEAHTSSGEELTHSLIPALDPAGEPCMFDTVTNQPFYNSGTGHFRVGIATLQQAREFQLPDNTGNATRVLAVSLPYEARTDFITQNHLSDLRLLNWIIDIQYRDGDIPSDYTKVDFLESTWSQSITVTGTFDKETGLWKDVQQELPAVSNISNPSFMSENSSVEGNWWVFPARFMAGSSSAAEFYWFKTSSAFNNLQGDGRYQAGIHWLGENTTFITANGTTQTSTLSSGLEFSSTKLLLIGGANVKFFRIKVSRGNAVEMDFVPVLNENGVPGMWDKVGKKFLEKSGTGTFIVGIKTLNDARMLDKALPDVPDGSTYSITLSLPVEASTDAPAQKALKDLAARRWSITVQYREEEIPAGYAKVAFLESSGTQYIDTEVVTDGTYTIQGRMSTIQRSCSYWGRRTTEGGAASEIFPDGNSILTSDNATHVCINYIKRVRNIDAIDIKQVHTYEMKEGQLLLSIDGLVQPLAHLNAWSVKAINNNRLSYYLFWENTLPGVYGLGKAVAAVYSFRMQDGSGNTVLDFIPVINTDGEPGMWDRVNKQFYENVGTGQFRVGLASKEAVRNLYLEPNVPDGTTINLSVPAGTTNEDTDTLKANNPNYTFNIQYRS